METNNTNIYQLVIKGHKEEIDIDLVLKNLAILFKCNPEQIRPLLASKNFIVKHSLDIETANKYQQILEDSGCIVVIESELQVELPKFKSLTSNLNNYKSAIFNSFYISKKQLVIGIVIICVIGFIGFYKNNVTVTYEDLQVRNHIAYLPNSDKPFTGRGDLFYKSGQKKEEANFKDGKQDGLTTSWNENGQKEGEANFKDGKEDGLSTLWNENGQEIVKNSDANGSEPIQNSIDTTTPILRKDFETAVIGKTPDEVIAAVGRPDQNYSASYTDTWSYKGRTKDSVTGKVDYMAIVHIENGRVTSVSFL